MRPRFPGICVAIAAPLLAIAPAFAHHSFSAQYDSNKQVTLKGVVTKLDWMNPHIYIYIDVTDGNGRKVNWALEGFPPNSLTRIGWTRTSIKPGDTISVVAFLAKDGSNLANMREVTLPDGQKLMAGAAAQ